MCPFHVFLILFAILLKCCCCAVCESARMFVLCVCRRHSDACGGGGRWLECQPLRMESAAHKDVHHRINENKALLVGSCASPLVHRALGSRIILSILRAISLLSRFKRIPIVSFLSLFSFCVESLRFISIYFKCVCCATALCAARCGLCVYEWTMWFGDTDAWYDLNLSFTLSIHLSMEKKILSACYITQNVFLDKMEQKDHCNLPSPPPPPTNNTPNKYEIL